MAIFRAAHAAPGVLVVAGGVAANQAIRAALRETTAAGGFRLVAPPARLCTDNAAMIAWAGAERLALGLAGDLADALAVPARPRWPLDTVTPSHFGGGAKGAKV
jgi:N6-L-threonylcarbamoyladenine synthase